MPNRTTTIAPIFGLRREIDRLFDDAFGGDGVSRRGLPWAPAAEVREDDRELTFLLELPGVSPADIEITAENGVLTVRGEKKDVRREGDDGQTRYHLLERPYGSFARSFQLTAGLDDSKIDAHHDNGLLTVHVPKAALPQPRRITINTPDGLGSPPAADSTKPRKKT
jgi:HSP20 family protein